MAVVVVLPWAPVTATWVCPSMRRACISPRRRIVRPLALAAINSGLSSFTAVVCTTTRAPPRFLAWCPWWMVTPREARRDRMGPLLRSEPLTSWPWRTRSSGQPAHADAADADEVVGSYRITPYAAQIRRFLD